MITNTFAFIKLPNSCKTIPVWYGNTFRLALVNDEDYKYLKRYKWYLLCEKYAVRYIRTGIKPQKNVRRKYKMILMHREILKNELEKSSNKEVDHINNDGLDNRRQNLRLCTRQGNQRNRHITEGVKKYGYKGIYKRNKPKPWGAQIVINDKNIWLGSFFTKQEAVNAYNKAARKYFGKFAFIKEYE